MNLSQRVWNLTQSNMYKMEHAISQCLENGIDANTLARKVRQYLINADTNFKRVRDENGNLLWSKNAQKFFKQHPEMAGQGIYRNPTRNAQRLARTEINIAYSASDYDRWQGMDFVCGIEIKLSNNHTTLGADGVARSFFDICDELQGKYPKDFKFTGWHPQCRCIAIPILMDISEYGNYLQAQKEGKDYKASNGVYETPENFKKWVNNNSERIDKAEKKGTTPYFVKDNPKFFAKGKPAKTEQQNVNISQEDITQTNIRAVEQKLGILKGKEMTFEEANELRANPLYNTETGYNVNCQSCVVANELRRRGFDVSAFKNTQKAGNIPYELSYQTEKAWIDPLTSKMPEKKHAGGYKGYKNNKSQYATLSELQKEFIEYTKDVGRYHIDFGWRKGGGGHIITVEKLQNGKYRFYDPQDGKIKTWLYLKNNIKIRGGIKILRVDELDINIDIINQIVKK